MLVRYYVLILLRFPAVFFLSSIFGILSSFLHIFPIFHRFFANFSRKTEKMSDGSRESQHGHMKRWFTRTSKKVGKIEEIPHEREPKILSTANMDHVRQLRTHMVEVKQSPPPPFPFPPSQLYLPTAYRAVYTPRTKSNKA